MLVAVSSPWASEKIFETVRDLAGRLEASVVVAHVARATESDETEDDTRQRADQTLATLTEKLKDVGIPAESMLLFGDDVGRAVLNAANAHHATLLVLGLSGRGRVARLIAGDVPQQIVKAADIPVFLFPPDWSGTV